MEKKETQSVNPATGETLFDYVPLNEEELRDKIKKSYNSFKKYKTTDPKTRVNKLKSLAEILEKNTDRLTKIITTEVGKPLSESRREVKKSISLINYYIDMGDKLFKGQDIKKDSGEAYVTFEPLGPVYHMSPYNYPLWVLMRRAVPLLIMGNTVLNKSSFNTPQIGILAEELFQEAGFKDGEFINFIIDQKYSELIINSPHVRGVSFVGSMGSGAQIAALAGKNIKKLMLDLGGNDAFIVLKDANIDRAVEQALLGRLKNAGQCGNSPNRFFIDESVYEDFKNKLLEQVKNVKMGDPMDENTQLGPLAIEEGLHKLYDQMKKAKSHGAKVLYGDKKLEDEKFKNGFYFMPTVLEVKEDNPILKEQTFGPVFSLLPFKSLEDAIRLANNTPYGLGASIFSKNEEEAKKLASELDVGIVSINKMVTFYEDLPNGGIKNSGIGREGGMCGAYEFVNIKTISINKETKSMSK